MLFPLHALSPACQPATLTPPNRPTPERNPNDTRTQPQRYPAPIPGPSPADIATKPRQHRAPQQHPQNTTERPAAGPPIRNASPPKNSPTVPPSIAMPETDAPEQDACHDQISEEVGSEARTRAREREAEITREIGRAAKSAFAMFLTPPSNTTAAHIFNFDMPPSPAVAADAAPVTPATPATSATAASPAAAAAATACSDPAVGRRWVERYRKAAEQGRAGAQCKLGRCYENGEFGLDKDEVKAGEWYRKAAAQGNAPAQRALRWLELHPPAAAAPPSPRSPAVDDVYPLLLPLSLFTKRVQNGALRAKN